VEASVGPLDAGVDVMTENTVMVIGLNLMGLGLGLAGFRGTVFSASNNRTTANSNNDGVRFTLPLNLPPE